jgi:hypothetical protein
MKSVENDLMVNVIRITKDKNRYQIWLTA